MAPFFSFCVLPWGTKPEVVWMDHAPRVVCCRVHVILRSEDRRVLQSTWSG